MGSARMRRHRSSLLTALTALTAASVALGVARSAVAQAQTSSSTATSPAAPGVPSRSGGADRPAKPAPDARLTPEAAFTRAAAFYESGQYVQCADAFAALLDDEALAGGLAFRAREQARVYRGACLIAQGKTTAADEQFRAAIRESPQMAPPNAIVFPQPVIDRFIAVQSALFQEIKRSEEERAEREREAAARARNRARAERDRVLRLERLAAEETIVVKNRRFMACVPFGTGQFQNRDYVLGSIFLASEALLLGTAVTAVSIELSLNSQANGGSNLLQLDQVAALNQNIHTANTVALVATGGLILVAAGGILEANLSFVPEFSDGVRPRKKPRTSSALRALTPTIGPATRGALLGVMGRF
jgi:hypothetical protein